MMPAMEVTHGGNIFAVSREHGWDWRDVLDFSASINPLGPAPGVNEAICRGIGRIVHYPERESATLLRALSDAWKVPAPCIVPGNGASELIHFLAGYLQAPKVTLAVPVFSEFHRAFPEAAQVPAADPSAWPEDGLLVLTQPLNPTGTPLALESWLRRTRHPVVLDESFLEFTGLPSMALARPGLYVLRSLTKFYALPGLRLGALIAQDAPQMRQTRPPWQVNVLASEAALAALADTAHAASTLDCVGQERAFLMHALQELPGVEPQPGCANYVFVRLAYPAQALAAHLLQRRILVRDCEGWPGVPSPSVRIAVRTRVENDALLRAWKEFSWCG
jgi:threonine-phosphate decarboxylase